MKPIAFVILAASICLPGPAQAETSGEIGAFVGALAGLHRGSLAGSEIHGVAPGLALEAIVRSNTLSLHLEGIPTLTATAGNRGPYGTTQASLALLNTTLISDIGRTRRVHLGFGFQVVDLTNRNGVTGETDAVRVTSPIYTAGLSFPTDHGFFDLDIADDPNVRGILHATVAGTNKPVPEQGAEVDYVAAYRWTHGRAIYRAGIRGLSYHTRNTNIGSLVDKNVGLGLTFDARLRLGR